MILFLICTISYGIQLGYDIIYDIIHILQTPNPHSVFALPLQRPIFPGHSTLMQAMAETIRTEKWIQIPDEARDHVMS